MDSSKLLLTNRDTYRSVAVTMAILPALNTNPNRSDPEGKSPIEGHSDLTDRSQLTNPNLLQVFISHVGDCR